MAQYPIKMLKDENGNPFIPLVAPEAVINTDSETLPQLLSGKISEPASDGTAGQVLTTDGSGGRTWTTVQGGGGGTSDYTALSNKPQINSTTLSGNKSSSDLGLQDALVSGTNIKTINSTSILGSGDITITVPTKTSDLQNDSNFVSTTGYASDSTAGVIKTNGITHGTAVDQNGLLGCSNYSYAGYTSSVTSNFAFVGKGTLNTILDTRNYLRSLNNDSSVTYTISPETKDKATVVTFGYYDTGTVIINDPWSNTITINNVPSGSYIIGATDLTTAPSAETTMCEIFGAWNNDYTDGLIHKRWTIRYNPNETNKLVQYSYTQKAASPTYDGTGVFGWYSTASSGEDLTTNYDVTPSDMYNLQLGSKWEWPSRVQTGATNSGMPYYMTSYSARTSDWDLYYVKYVSMNGSYYEYAYDDTNVYKEVYPDGGGVACFGKDTKVWTKTGEKTIDKVGLGDEVLVYDWCKDRVVYAPIVETFSHEQEEVYHIVLENDNDLYVTGDHPILERDNGKIPASTIKKGHVLMNDKGIGYPVKSNRKVQYNDTVYEIHMEGSVLNYFVGDDKIMVFNEIITGEAN